MIYGKVVQFTCNNLMKKSKPRVNALLVGWYLDMSKSASWLEAHVQEMGKEQKWYAVAFRQKPEDSKGM